MPECVYAFVQWLHEWQEFFGGLIGAAGAAGGAVWAVYLTLGKQRKDETNNVTSAVVTEVTAFRNTLLMAWVSASKSLTAYGMCHKITPPTLCERCLLRPPSTTRLLIVSACCHIPTQPLSSTCGLRK